MKLGCFLLRCSRSTKLLGSSEEAGLRELTKESGGRAAKGRKSRADHRKLLLRANKQETRPPRSLARLNLDTHTARTLCSPFPPSLPPLEVAPKIPRFEKRAAGTDTENARGEAHPSEKLVSQKKPS